MDSDSTRDTPTNHRDQATVRDNLRRTPRGGFRKWCPHFLLWGVFMLYLIIGAAIFMAIEGPHRKNDNFNSSDSNSTDPYSTVVVFDGSEAKNETDGGSYETEEHGEHEELSFLSSLLFCTTTITTIGYGDVTPITALGKFFCVIYATLGIPFAILCLASVGKFLAGSALKICQILHLKLCLRGRECVDTFPICAGSSDDRNEGAKRRQSSSPRKGADNVDTVELVLEEIDGSNATSEEPAGTRCECRHRRGMSRGGVLEEVPLVVVVFILVGYFGVSAALISAAEGWSYGIGLYFTFITLTTIGYGDILPTTLHARDSFVPTLFTLLGLFVVSMCIVLVHVRITNAYKGLMTKLRLC